MDLLMYSLKGLSVYMTRLLDMGVRHKVNEIALFSALAVFSTLTQVSYDHERMRSRILEAYYVKEELRTLYESTCASKGLKPETPLPLEAAFVPATGNEKLWRQGRGVGYDERLRIKDKEIVDLEEFLLFGLRGLCAYYYHASAMKFIDDTISEYIFRNLEIQTRSNETKNSLIEALLECGKVNFATLELLDRAHNTTFGNSTPTKIRTTPVKGKGIIISGHDLWDLKCLLEQTEGKGINIYTHGEMEPAHGYPGLKKFPHLVGQFGGAWHDQKEVFARFPGAILLTSNCLLKPLKSYKGRFFQTGPTGIDGGQYIEEKENGEKDFTPVIEAALREPGFAATEEDPKYSMAGFGHNTILGLTNEIVQAVKKGSLKHFFVIGGCDAPTTVRNYYTQFADAIPRDCLVLTMGCGKYRLKEIEAGMGTLQELGIPRLLNMGQCNDAYTALKVAVSLAEAFNCGVNDLPLSLNISWVEQKAVADLLTLFYLGVRNVRIGPGLPAFVTPSTLDLLVNKFGLKAITSPIEDLATMMARENAGERDKWIEILQRAQKEKKEANNDCGCPPPPAPAAPKKTFTASEVAQHCDIPNKDVWIIIHNKVYDLSEYVEDHPGGPNEIAAFAGADATAKFEDAKHSASALDAMAKFYIGDLVTRASHSEEDATEISVFDEHTVFSTVVRLVSKTALTTNVPCPTNMYRFELPKSVRFTLPTGLHVFLAAHIDDKEVARAYTPVAIHDGSMDFAIKIYPNGKMTSYIDRLQIGDELEMRGPKGRFVYKRNTWSQIGMIAGGTGIAPMLQVIKSIVADDADRTRVSLIFANPNLANVILKKELEQIQADYPDKFQVYFTLDNAHPGWTGGSGFISKAMLSERMPSNTRILLCGPPPMIKSATAHLCELGYKDNQLFSF